MLTLEKIIFFIKPNINNLQNNHLFAIDGLFWCLQQLWHNLLRIKGDKAESFPLILLFVVGHFSLNNLEFKQKYIKNSQNNSVDIIYKNFKYFNTWNMFTKVTTMLKFCRSYKTKALEVTKPKL